MKSERVCVYGLYLTMQRADWTGKAFFASVRRRTCHFSGACDQHASAQNHVSYWRRCFGGIVDVILAQSGLYLFLSDLYSCPMHSSSYALHFLLTYVRTYVRKYVVNVAKSA